MDNIWIVTLLFWPAVVLLCAGINMLISWTFSWSELIFDYLMGVVAGALLFTGSQPDAGGAALFFLAFSHGLPGLLYASSDGFRDAMGEPATFFWVLAGIRLGATVWTAALDYGSVALGATLGPGQVLYSLLLAPVKMSFALLTSAVGLLIWLVGLMVAIFGSGRAGFAGGVLFTEFSPGGSSYYATTLGSTMHCWNGDMPFRHELYHTRQYVYYSDWLIPFWCLGCLWGLASAAASGQTVSTASAFGADSSDEVGNPIEVAAYHL